MPKSLVSNLLNSFLYTSQQQNTMNKPHKKENTSKNIFSISEKKTFSERKKDFH